MGTFPFIYLGCEVSWKNVCGVLVLTVYLHTSSAACEDPGERTVIFSASANKGEEKKKRKKGSMHMEKERKWEKG
jgi:hypothetical protein